MSYITELLEGLLNDHEGNYDFGQDFLYNGEGDPDFGEDFLNQGGPDPGEGGPDPGDGPDGTDPDDKSSGKGKGKARAITPESPEEYKNYSGKGKARAITPQLPELPELPYTDLDKKPEEDDFEKARLESLKDYLQQFKQGESSKQGELSKQLELFKQGELPEQGESSQQAGQGEYLPPEEQAKNMLETYHELKQRCLEAVRSFNDTVEKINREGDSMNEQEKAFWLNETIRVRNVVDNYSSHIQNLKDQLNIDSEENSQQDSGDSWSAYSSDEESISSKRSDSSGNESRPSKRPRN